MGKFTIYQRKTWLRSTAESRGFLVGFSIFQNFIYGIKQNAETINTQPLIIED